MSKKEKAVNSSLSQKRIVRRGKRMTHTENPLKDLMVEYCEREGITQAQFVEKIIKDELQRLDILK